MLASCQLLGHQVRHRHRKQPGLRVGKPGADRCRLFLDLPGDLPDPRPQAVQVALELLLFRVAEELQLLVGGLLQLGPDGPFELLEDGGDVGRFLFRTLGQGLLEACGPLPHPDLERLDQRGRMPGPEIEQPPFDPFGRLEGQRCGQGISHLADIEAAEAALPDQPAGGDDLLVEPVAVAADQDQPGVGDHGRGLQHRVWNQAGRDSMEPLGALSGPDLGPEESQAHLDQPVIQVGQHDIVAPVGQVMIEDDRADLPGVGVRQALRAERPGPLQRG